MPPAAIVGKNGLVMNAAVAGWLRDRIRPLLRPAGPLPRLSRRGQIFDALLALGLLLLAIQAGEGEEDEPRFVPDLWAPLPPAPPFPEPFPPAEPDPAGWPFAMILVVLPLVVRRRFPLLVLWGILAMAPIVSDFDDGSLRLSFFACVVAAYTAAVYSPYYRLALMTLPVAAFFYADFREPSAPTVPDGAVPFLILMPIAVAAYGLHRWKRRADEHHERLSTMERDQAEALHRATERERARIARELHDVVTHNVSVMVIQAGAARKVMQADPGQAREALLAVEAGGRAAMTELRHVMGLLTTDGDGSDAAGLAPQPGLDGLHTLVQRVRDAGIPVDVKVTGQPRELLPGVELAAYRVVQEALTNTVKHAAGATATVVVDYGTDQLRVEVTDTGGRPGVSAATGNGHGLIGLRERLALYGGTLQTGRRLSGGYRVRAQFPLEAT